MPLVPENKILCTDLEQLLAAVKREGKEFLWMAQDSKQWLQASLSATELLKKQFEADQATIWGLALKNCKVDKGLIDTEAIMNTKTQELESKLQTLRGKQETLEAEVVSLKGTVTQANTEGRIVRKELGRASTTMMSKCPLRFLLILLS